MAKAGFAGSLVVDANWKGRNLNRGMRDSKKRVNNFGKSIRRMVGAVALGAGAYVSAKGLIGLLKMSKAGSEAWSKWLIAWASIKSSIGKLVAGPAAKFLNWASDVGLQFATYLNQFDSLSALFNDVFGSSVLKGFKQLTEELVALWKTLVELFTKAQDAVADLAFDHIYNRPTMQQQQQERGGKMLYGGVDQLSAGPSAGPMAYPGTGY
ncbi:MAG: hypothetical protein GY903_06690 [Fuerstiella sp.]|nr:hypothetical protein [Fuerstiella sp.]MCP4854162.1 hypothetical protein [Fuerstiella sp.]